MGAKGRDKGRKKELPGPEIPAGTSWMDDDAINAIRNGRVDALVFSGQQGSQIFTLSGSENGYRLFVESMSEGAATIAADGTILYCNRTLADLLDSRLEQVMGSNVQEWVPERERGLFGAIFTSSRQDAAKVELSLVTRSGKAVPALVSLRAFREFGSRAFCMVVTDLTEQKRHEDLISTAKLSRTILEQSGQAIAVCDTDGRVILASRVLHELCGRNPLLQLFDELLPLQIQANDAGTSGSRQFSVSEVLAGRSFRTIEVALRRSDGENGLYLLSANSLPLPSSNENGCVVTLFDIEERKRSEEALRNSERLAATGRLAAVIAHEINNPLESVVNLLYLIQCDPSLSAQVAEFVQTAQAELGRVAHITRQTLAFHRESSEPTELEVSALIESIVYLHSPRMVANEIDLVRDLRYQGALRGYQSELRQLLSNILGNAIEACGRNGRVWLRVYRAIEHTAARRQGVRIVIADSGPGIAGRDRHRIFEPFFTTKGEKGTGLGLWVSQGIVQKHRGSLRVWSSTRPGRTGTVFSVFLPDVAKVRSIDWKAHRTAASSGDPKSRIG